MPEHRIFSLEETAEIIAGEISPIICGKGQGIIAIDGRCAAGKTTLAMALKEKLHCELIHTDDFFLRPEQRTKQRYEQPGGNMDRERLLEEVLLPVLHGKAFSYRPFDCKTMSLGQEIHGDISTSHAAIIEGTYSTHPELAEHYDLKIFLTVESDEQHSRILKREGERAVNFFEKWIPLEEKYFLECRAADNCDMKWTASLTGFSRI